MNKGDLRQFILEFERSGFSAKETAITVEEARKVAAKIMNKYLAKIDDEINGEFIQQMLKEIREKKK